MAIWLCLLIPLAGTMAYIRFAPSPAVRWHVPVIGKESKNFDGGATRVVAGSAEIFETLHQIALDTKRTRVLAGAPGAGRVTYITRSRVFGFPDYTTVQLDGDQLILHARLRFGRSDFGVNARRLDAWIGKLTS